LPTRSAPPGATTSTVTYSVGFAETDAMAIVHHSNYLRYFERARVQWLKDHDQDYRAYMEAGLNFAVTHVELDYHGPARFDDSLEITTWVEWIRGASLRMAYRIEREGELLVSGATEHAAVNDEGRVRRIPKPSRARIAKAIGATSDAD
jgi:acyl-CoA thioester hydrolase